MFILDFYMGKCVPEMFCLQDILKVPHKLLINTQLTAVVFPKEIHFCDNHDGQFSSISQQDDQRDIAPPKVNTKNKIDIIVKKMCPCPLL